MLDSKATHSAQFIHHNVNEFYTHLRQLLDDLFVASPKAHKITRDTHAYTVYTEDHADDSMFIPICCWLHRLPFLRSCYFCCCDCVSSLNILRAKDEHAHALVLVLPVLRNQFEIIQIIVLLIIWPIFWPLIERADDFAFSTSSDKKTVKLKYRLGVFINRISDHSITAHEDFDSEIRMI